MLARELKPQQSLHPSYQLCFALEDGASSFFVSVAGDVRLTAPTVTNPRGGFLCVGSLACALIEQY